MLKTIIVEDEEPALQRLKKMLLSFEDIQVLDTCRLGKEAAASIDSHRPDVVFLDIELPDISGLDLLKLISHEPQIIFVTAYHHYAIAAFDLKAIDYLLKPFSPDRLEAAVQKVREKMQHGDQGTEMIRDMISTWQAGQNYLRRLPSKIGDRIYIVTDDEILYISSEHKMVYAFTEKSKFLLNYTMEELQNRLDPEKFFRIHRSSIVNLNYVALIESWFAGGYRLTIKNREKTELLISRSAGKKMRQNLGW